MSDRPRGEERARPRAVVLVDGEHYPPVTLDAIAYLRAELDVAAAVMLGGSEKLAGPLRLGELPVVSATTPLTALREALDRFEPAVVFDLSDAPVVDTGLRFRLASLALSRGATYRGADFTLQPPAMPLRARLPTVAVIGTGKRTGKTAVAAAFARDARDGGVRTVIVAMGRGGPAEPVVTRGDLRRPTPRELLALAQAGEHAASDSYEDAVVAGVTTVGARRAGAGLAGSTVWDTVARALAAAEAQEPDIIILEGSGTAFPPVACDATILVVGGSTPAAEIAGGLGPLRILLADLAVVTMAEAPVLSSPTLAALTSSASEFARDVPIVRTVFRPAPVGSVAGKKVFYATTAPDAVGPALKRHLEDAHGATVVGMTHRLADRPRLSEDLAKAEGTYEVLVTEVKAAAIDVAVRAALDAGARVTFADNEPVPVDGDLSAAFARVLALARDRFASQAPPIP